MNTMNSQGKSHPTDFEDKRDVTHYPAGDEHEIYVVNTISRYLAGFRLIDILWTQHHTEDFKLTRSEYLLIRLRFLLWFFIIAVPAWLIVDAFTLQWDHFLAMVPARLTLSGILLGLWFQSLKKTTQTRTAVLLATTMLVTSVFYIAAMLILASGVSEVPLAGYTAIPFMAISLMGVFPVTLLYSISVMAMIVGCVIGLEGWFGNLYTLETFNTFWILVLTCGVALWIQSGQLLMLLKLYRESTRDPLTGLINRRVLMKQIVAEVEMHETTGRDFSVLMLDLDRFKRVNDEHGHLTGDLVLKNAANLVAGELRSSDVIARFGGEEFIVVLPGQIGEEALPVAERIRRRFEDAPVITAEGLAIPITTSIGVTQYETGERIEVTLDRVDESLYMAKNNGRNQVQRSQSDDFSEGPNN